MATDSARDLCLTPGQPFRDHKQPKNVLESNSVQQGYSKPDGYKPVLKNHFWKFAFET
jgi:hypothetical protein